MSDEIIGIAILDNSVRPRQLCMVYQCGHGGRFIDTIPVYDVRESKPCEPCWAFRIDGDRLHVTPSVHWRFQMPPEQTWHTRFHNGGSWNVQFQYAVPPHSLYEQVMEANALSPYTLQPLPRGLIERLIERRQPKIKRVKYEHDGKVHLEQYHFTCPGCKTVHAIGIGPSYHSFNGNFEAPTFKPSLLCTWTQFEVANDPKTKPVDWRCHSYITDGKIQFLGDCTHALAGQTVEMFDIEEEHGQQS